MARVCSRAPRVGSRIDSILRISRVDESDLSVRLAASAFLDERRKRYPDLLERQELRRGFVFEAQRVPPQAPQGIFKRW